MAIPLQQGLQNNLLIFMSKLVFTEGKYRMLARLQGASFRLGMAKSV